MMRNRRVCGSAACREYGLEVRRMLSKPELVSEGLSDHVDRKRVKVNESKRVDKDSRTRYS